MNGHAQEDPHADRLCHLDNPDRVHVATIHYPVDAGLLGAMLEAISALEPSAVIDTEGRIYIVEEPRND